MPAGVRLILIMAVALLTVGLLIFGAVKSKQMRVPFTILAILLAFIYIVSFVVLFIL
ncbi:hypothetical protein [Terribacillus sp. 7520-G]|uniref:hypothetical protein n=1 Tax=Terribacillus TaxID=459532 RepID=UPI0013044506|nr:hypothetical protein [Terribacillus sp. 7520-G]